MQAPATSDSQIGAELGVQGVARRSSSTPHAGWRFQGGREATAAAQPDFFRGGGVRVLFLHQ